MLAYPKCLQVLGISYDIGGKNERLEKRNTSLLSLIPLQPQYGPCIVGPLACPSSLPACKRTLTYLQAAQSGLTAEQGETKGKSGLGAKFRFPTNGIH